MAVVATRERLFTSCGNMIQYRESSTRLGERLSSAGRIFMRIRQELD